METIEEAAEKFYSEQSESYENAIEPTFDNSRYLVTGFIDGAKWQQEQDKNKFNEEDMRASYNAENEGWVNFDFWFKQFKKK
jgi:hypothetical protein